MKIGIVGHGSIGSRHAENFTTLGHEVLVFDPAGRQDVKTEKEIYEDSDAVVIATPTSHHDRGLRACVLRDKPVLIEKPLGLDPTYFRGLLSSAREKNLVVMMGNNLRFHPCVIQAEEWLTEHRAGLPVWAHFTCAQESSHPIYRSDGVILNTGAHEVDLALHLFGPARVIMANAGVTGYGQEEIADFLLEHDSGVRSSFHLDFVTPNAIREAWIVGTKDKIGLEFRNRNASLGARAQAFGGSYDDDYLAEARAFIERINGNPSPGASGEDGLNCLETLCYVRKKAGLK